MIIHPFQDPMAVYSILPATVVLSRGKVLGGFAYSLSPVITAANHLFLVAYAMRQCTII